MRKTILAFAIQYLFFSAISAYADQEGGYLGVRAGLAKNDHSCESAALECDRDGTGYGIFGGYNFNRRFGVELGYNDVPDSTAVYPEIRLQGELSAIDLAARYSHELFGRTQLFAKPRGRPTGKGKLKAGVSRWMALASAPLSASVLPYLLPSVFQPGLNINISAKSATAN
ncbi:MAG: porin family protein [Cellvibrionaceae bacterium]|nr:porin family protein [Cellvibrionaceae bacterium]